jgi:hypothetical protein
MNATKEGDGEVQGRCTGKPQSGETLALIAAWREACAAGTLPQWRTEGIEKIEGWEWGLERGAAPGRGLSQHCVIIRVLTFAMFPCFRNRSSRGFR